MEREQSQDRMQAVLKLPAARRSSFSKNPSLHCPLIDSRAKVALPDTRWVTVTVVGIVYGNVLRSYGLLAENGFSATGSGSVTQLEPCLCSASTLYILYFWAPLLRVGVTV